MSGETNLTKLIQNMNPVLNDGEFVFCMIEPTSLPHSDDLVMTFTEKEGITAILRKELADKLALNYDFVAGWITLEVQSSLSAIGLTANFSTALASEGISCNVVAGFYHDHLFVPITEAERAMKALQKISG